MKKIFALILALCMILTLCACGKKSDSYVIINEDLGAEYYGIAFRAGDEAVRDAIDGAVAKLVADGTYKEIAAKYEDIDAACLTFLNDGAPKAAEAKAEPRTFIMGIDPEYPPFSYMGDDGEYTGFDVEVCKAACDLLGWDFQVFAVNWDEKLVQLDANECDCVWSGMTILDSMKEAGYVLSEPYFYNTQVLLVKESSGIKSSADLAGKTVAVQLGTSGEELLNNDLADLTATFGNLVTCDSFLKCFTELDGGSVDAVFVDLPVATGYVNSNNK